MFEYTEKEINEIKNYYKATEEEYKDMLEKAKSITFFDCESYEHPIAVIIGGQTGARKRWYRYIFNAGIQ